MNFKFILFLITFSNLSAQKVLILTHVYNRPDFIKLQYNLYKKFLMDDYELVIFDNSENIKITNQMQDECKKLNIKYIRIPQSIHTNIIGYNIPSERVSNAIQFSLEILAYKFNGIVAIISSDIFLTKKFSINDYLKDFSIGGHYQNREHINYIWDGIIFLNMTQLPKKELINLNCGYVENILTDVGGHIYYYFNQFPFLKIKYFDQIYVEKNQNSKIFMRKINGKELIEQKEYLINELNQFDKNELSLINTGIENIEFFMEKSFIHYRNGSNWNNHSFEYHQNKTQIINNFFEQILI